MCLKSKKILVIDEDYQSGRTIINFLKSRNYDVCYASSRAAGIQISIEFKPDLVLCDINMQPTDGLNVFNELKGSPGEVPARFIFMSTSSETKDFRFVMNLGADDYIVKPIDLDDLNWSVENQLYKFNRIREFYLKKQEEKITDHDRQVSELVRILKTENISASGSVIQQLNDVLKPQNEIPVTSHYGLFSKRETEVLHLSFEGLTSKLIAEKLSISGRTVEKFRSKLMEKTGSNNMIEVINYAIRNKLVEFKVLLPFLLLDTVL